MHDQPQQATRNSVKAHLPSPLSSHEQPSNASAEKSLPRLQIISFFCGAGGLDLGFSRAGFDPILAADFDRASVDTHNANSNHKVAVKLDLSKTSANSLHKRISQMNPNAQPVGIIGGPPCQGFSRANTQRSNADPRNNLAKRYTNMIVELTELYPSIEFFVFENVSGLLAKENTDLLNILKKNVAECFDVFSACLNAQNYGVPQSRERFFMVGLRKKKKKKNEFSFPQATTSVPKTVREAISHLPEAMYFRRNLTLEEIAYHPNHWTMRPLSKRFGPDLVTNGRSLIRLAWDKPSRTVAYGHREIHVHPSGIRRLTIYEAMLLQGFPPTYQLCGNLSEQVTQVSNAVPPPLAHAIAMSLRDAITKS